MSQHFIGRSVLLLGLQSSPALSWASVRREEGTRHAPFALQRESLQRHKSMRLSRDSVRHHSGGGGHLPTPHQLAHGGRAGSMRLAWQSQQAAGTAAQQGEWLPPSSTNAAGAL